MRRAPDPRLQRCAPLLGTLHPRIVDGTGLVAVVFGVIGVLLAAGSIRTFLRPPADKQYWWYFHMRGMIASYIAAFTAFTVVNLAPHFGNAWWIWLGRPSSASPAAFSASAIIGRSSSRRRRSLPARRGLTGIWLTASQLTVSPLTAS